MPPPGPEPTNGVIADRIMVAEGWDRYTNEPGDKGGPTKFGVTQRTLSWSRGHAVTAEEVRGLTADEARAIILSLYIVANRYDELKSGWLRHVVVDAAYHSGPGDATQWLQSALNVTVDGVCGTKTIAAANDEDGWRLARRVLLHRAFYLGELVGADLTQRKFADGWRNRLDALMDELA